MQDARMAVGASVPSGDADDFSFDVVGFRREENVLGKFTWYLDTPRLSAPSGGAGSSSAASGGAADHRSVHQQVIDDIKAKLAHARATSSEMVIKSEGRYAYTVFFDKNRHVFIDPVEMSLSSGSAPRTTKCIDMCVGRTSTKPSRQDFVRAATRIVVVASLTGK
jgi:hypothetical protein